MARATIYLFATELEAAPFRALLPDADVRVVGVGMAEAAAGTARIIAECRPDTVLLCGIAGACDDSLQVGEVVSVVSDSVVALPSRYRCEYRSSCVSGLRAARAYTVNRTGESLPSHTAEALPAVEQMEGAGVAAVAASFGVEYLHVRAISNRVSDDRSQWRVAEAIESLAQRLCEIEEM